MNIKTTQWIPFEEGRYKAEQAFLIAPDHSAAAAIDDLFVQVYIAGRGLKQIKGDGIMRPMLMVELHEDNDVIDMVIDLGGEFKFYLKNPTIKAGKIFSPDVSSIFQFYPVAPWEQISEADFDALLKRLFL